MRLDELKAQLDALSWEDQADFELSERDSDAAAASEQATSARIRALAERLSPTSLDELEREPGYTSWLLRLSPFVRCDDARARARRYQRDPDPTVRYWAARLLDTE